MATQNERLERRRALGHGLAANDRTFPIKDQLRVTFGGMWDGERKYWWFGSASDLQSATALAARTTPQPRLYGPRGGKRKDAAMAARVRATHDRYNPAPLAPGPCQRHGNYGPVECPECADERREAAAAKARHESTPLPVQTLTSVPVPPDDERPANHHAFNVGTCVRCKRWTWVTRTRIECRTCAVAPGGEFEPF